MTPVPEHRARKTVERLSMVYAFLGWNFVTILLYFTWSKHIPEGPERLSKIIEVMDLDHARVIQFSGLEKVSEYNLDRTEEVLKDTKRHRMVTDLNPSPPRQQPPDSTGDFFGRYKTNDSSKTV